MADFDFDIDLYSDLSTSLGNIDECISCEVSEQLNSSFELVLEYPATGSLVSSFVIGRFIYCKPNPYDSKQYFMIYRISKSTEYVYTIYAEHITYAYNRFICKPDRTHKDEAAAVGTIIQYMNAQSSNNPSPPSGYSLNFASSSVSNTAKWTVEDYTEIRNVMDMAAKLYDAEWKLDNSIATLVKRRGQNRGVVLTNSTNLISLMTDDDVTDVYTHIFPYWRGHGEGGEVVYVYSNPEFVPIANIPYKKFRAYIYDCSGHYNTRRPTQQELYNEAVEFGNANYIALNKIITGFNADIVQRGKTIEGASTLSSADHIEIGDTISVNVPDLSISLSKRVTGTRYDAIRDMLISITVGEKRAEITDIFAEVKNYGESIGRVEEGIVVIQTQVSEQVSQISDTVDGLTDDIETISGSISDLSDDLEDVQSAIEELTAIPDSVVLVDANELYAIYGTKKVTWTADGTGNERHNFVRTVSDYDPEDEEET